MGKEYSLEAAVVRGTESSELSVIWSLLNVNLLNQKLKARKQQEFSVLYISRDVHYLYFSNLSLHEVIRVQFLLVCPCLQFN